jgi:hypothetical protein
MCACDPTIRTPCCGKDSCHSAAKTISSLCPWCSPKQAPRHDADWDKIIKAVEYLRDSSATRLEGPGWMVYKVGNIVRIDLKEQQ